MMEYSPFLLRIDTLTGHSFEIIARPVDTVENIKARVAFQEGLSHRTFHLINDSRELRDEETMSSLGLSDGSHVKLVVSLRGGPVATKRVHLPPIGRPQTNEWNNEEFEEEVYRLDPDMELMEPHTGGRIIIYQNGEKTYFLHVDEKVTRGGGDKMGSGDMNERVKENVTMMRKLQGLKGRMTDHKPPKTPKSIVRKIKAEIQLNRSRTCPGQPPYTQQQLAKYVRAKIKEETEAGNRLLTPSVILRPANLLSDRSRPNSGKSNKPGTARKKKLRCADCRKKLGLASNFQCRCGLTFCSKHRTAESHNCVFDYKAEGKRVLREANPVVVACSRRVQHF